MKNLSLVINGILAVAIIILFILFFKTKSTTENTPSLKFENDTTATLPIAYVNIDSVLTNYQYAKEASDALMKKTETSRASINQKQKQLVSEQQEFQRKYQNNAFLSQERAEQEATRIQKLGAELEQTASRLDNELTMEQIRVNNQLADSVRLCIKEFNKTANYHIIFSNSGLDNVLYAKEKYNITDKVIELLNARHAASPKK
ncbi:MULTISPECIES: OmpH family outer membrane protein [unclassified Dysgonomonas]|uniref:OmpH family outer membrane protein n=1 Tax=unclassified Dysgonomonas TaxID=2630389 RepID=UPI000682EC70|nr:MULTISPECIES: OmpH family outer membrane protein [unclassified Dysgonomonas]MBD8347094.1 OmpH family outer membrane protein [Dysgonomonas sp. HGC4]MBF0574847.1 OmpH family outer membrane protein [Dysgonomonas sp. GY617]